MSEMKTAGTRFREAMAAERPLRIVGAINAYSAILARDAGLRAVYLSGAGVANASRGLPDLGLTTLEDVVTDAKRIAVAVDLPLLVDIDTGFDDAGDTVARLIEAGVAAVHMEDQVEAKRCGHRPGKRLVPAEEMCARIKAAIAGRYDESFVLMARTDAAAVEGLDAAIARSRRYIDAGAEMIFAEALTTLGEYERFVREVPAPILANITEFGKTPMFTAEELRGVGVAMMLFPLSAFRAMSAAALGVYEVIADEGTQKSALGMMQTREELYEHLDYHSYEKRFDEQINKG